MRQHTEGVVESIIWALLEIYLAFEQWNKFENPLKIDKVIAMSLMYTLKNLVLNEHKLVLNHTQALCLILTTQACVVLTQDDVS